MTTKIRFLWATALLLVMAATFAALPNEVDGQPLPSLAPLVKRVAPAVVNIQVKQTIHGPSPYRDEMFRRFFGFPDVPGGAQQVASAGSGVIVDAEKGYILTNHHVVERADEANPTVRYFASRDDGFAPGFRPRISAALCQPGPLRRSRSGG